MAQKTTVGVRLPQDYLDAIDEICQSTGLSRTDVLLEAVATYIGKTPPARITSTLEELQLRVETLEKKQQVA
jgi:metal-responsive CopG/Arc/MetJ family transcriptional regulator